MKTLMALNALGTLATASVPQARAAGLQTCSNTQTKQHNYLDPCGITLPHARYILSDILIGGAPGFNLNKFFHAGHAMSGLTDPLANTNFYSINGYHLREGYYGSPQFYSNPYGGAFRDRFGHQVARDEKFETSLWLRTSKIGWGDTFVPPKPLQFPEPDMHEVYDNTSVYKIKFTFRDTIANINESYWLYYNVWGHGSTFYSFVGVIPSTIHDGPSSNGLNKMHINYHDDIYNLERSVTVPSIFGHPVTLNNIQLTPYLSELKCVWPYMVIGTGTRRSNMFNFRGDYLSGFSWNQEMGMVHTNGLEGEGSLKNLAYNLAMSMYMKLN